jgi:hypothetical protein
MFSPSEAALVLRHVQCKPFAYASGELGQRINRSVESCCCVTKLVINQYKTQ